VRVFARDGLNQPDLNACFVVSQVCIAIEGRSLSQGRSADHAGTADHTPQGNFAVAAELLESSEAYAQEMT